MRGKMIKKKRNGQKTTEKLQDNNELAEVSILFDKQ